MSFHSLAFNNQQNVSGIETHARCKGCNRNKIDVLTMESMAELFNPETDTERLAEDFVEITSHNHQLVTRHAIKQILTVFDDKRYIDALKGQPFTFSFGHYNHVNANETREWVSNVVLQDGQKLD